MSLKRTSPDVGSISRSRQRPVVVLPDPDSPTRPNVSPGIDVERHVVDGAHRAATAEPVRGRETPSPGRGRRSRGVISASPSSDPATCCAENTARHVPMRRRESLVRRRRRRTGRAARREGAAGRRLPSAGTVPGMAVSRSPDCAAGNRGEQRAGVRMRGRAEDPRHRRLLDDAARST